MLTTKTFTTHKECPTAFRSTASHPTQWTNLSCSPVLHGASMVRSKQLRLANIMTILSHSEEDKKLKRATITWLMQKLNWNQWSLQSLRKLEFRASAHLREDRSSRTRRNTSSGRPISKTTKTSSLNKSETELEHNHSIQMEAFPAVNRQWLTVAWSKMTASLVLAGQRVRLRCIPSWTWGKLISTLQFRTRHRRSSQVSAKEVGIALLAST